MNENLNLVEILKDCPQGTKLYSIIHGEVEFEKIVVGDYHPIKYKFKDTSYDYVYTGSVSIDGGYSIHFRGECTLFPSKDQRDWSKFKVESEMIDGEFYYCFYGKNQKENSFIFIYKQYMLYKTKCYVALNILSSMLFKDALITINNKNITELRKATEEEKQQLLNAIKRKGYKWDEEKKELVNIKLKSGINTLQSFDKVLARDFDDNVWTCTFYECFGRDIDYPFATMRGLYKQCIPYNEETKHLVNTTEIPPKKYITWEE